MQEEDDLLKAALPSGWHPLWPKYVGVRYKGKGGGVAPVIFELDWTFPMTITLEAGPKKTFKSYAEYHHFIRSSCISYVKRKPVE